MKILSALLIIIANVAVPLSAQQNEPKTPIIEIVETNGQVRTDTTYVFLRVFSDGSTEAHDLRHLDLRHVQISRGKLKPSTYRAVEQVVKSQWWQNLPATLGPFYNETDSGLSWDVATPHGNSVRHVQLVNFNPYVTRYLAKKPYPTELEKFVCLVLKARGEAIQDDELGVAEGCKKF